MGKKTGPTNITVTYPRTKHEKCFSGKGLRHEEECRGEGERGGLKEEREDGDGENGRNTTCV